MKLNTFIVISKGVAHILVGIFTPWMGALAQWINSGEWPGKIIWLGVILPLSVLGAGNAWISFTSGAWNDFEQQKKADDTQTTQTIVTEPTKPTVEPKEIKV